MDLKSTLNLPDPNATIPMKANLPTLEASIQAKWEAEGIYQVIQAARADAPTFVLHDGPPYTNGQVHTGTALNKILKDLVMKSRTMMGFRTPYVPGFDNHGLPIEQAVLKKFAAKKETPDRVTLIEACRAHAQEFIDVQTRQFKRLGVFGQWDHPYRTMDYRVEAEIVRTFARLVEAGLVYKGLRPTLWSPTSRTALADTEIVYRDHVSKAIYVRFALREDPNQIFNEFPNLHTVIWTTTPWTIPANLACAFHPEFSYAIVRVGDHHYLVLNDLVARLAEVLGWTDYEVVATRDGINFEGASFTHPLVDRPSIAVMAGYVTGEDGTGVVHTAPSHGRDDFYTGQKYHLPVPNTVDERGILTAETGEFAGTFYKKCDEVVVDRLLEVGALLHASDYHHSYPYAERDEQPVIFRATEQWFVSIEPIRDRMLEAITPVSLETRVEDPEAPGVTWVPESGYARISAMVKNRPDWCISRQRPWGVGIPVLYGRESRVPVFDPVVFEAIAQLVAEHGSQSWFTAEPWEFLPAGYTHPETGEVEFDKETDILDVWFDSGSSHLFTLEGNVYPDWGQHWPADLYLEGSDQHRGWFNTSLILSIACRGEAPYRQVVTHGFVDDEEGKKMSKRDGNVIYPDDICNSHGADLLRHWVASVDYSNDVPFGFKLLDQVGEHYRNIRNTLRFLIGNLQGYDGKGEIRLDLDRWVTEQVDLLVADCVSSYQLYDFDRVMSAVHNFCRDELSKFYLDAIKDRMYCDHPSSPARRSGQAACLYVADRILRLVAPVLVHTAEETWMKLQELRLAEDDRTIHAQEFRAPSEERLAEIEGSPLQVRFALVRSIAESVSAAFERYKGTDGIKNSQDVTVVVPVSEEQEQLLTSIPPSDLAIYCRVSEVTLSTSATDVTFARSPYLLCDRSRLRRADVHEVIVGEETVKLSARDRHVLQELGVLV